ncbi:MAG TPA: tetratricopeptide repeat protein, partial [Pyrinomonadaceae bacterium]
MTKLQEASLRHAKYYLDVAQQNRGNLNPLDLPNIVTAVNYLAELGDWELFAAMVSAVSDYWLKVSQWNDYIKFNALLLSADLERVEERIKVISKLAEIEEFRGNYEKASGLYKDLLQLYEQREENPPEDTLSVLRYLYKLARIKNDDAEARLYLEQGISISREHN